MRKKNGFTLTEILVTIAMIAVLGTIIIYSTIGVTNSSKENQYKRMIENIKNSAKTYVSLYPDEFGDLFSSKAFTYISLNQLISAGLLDEELVNPYTKEPIDTNQECNSETIDGETDTCLAYIKVYVDGDSLEMNYKYPLMKDDFNTHVWLQLSTVITNALEDGKFTPVYAYSGLQDGTIKPSTDFAFVKEDGNLIEGTIGASLLSKYKSDYNLSYTMPSSFVSCAEVTNPITEICKAPYIPATLPKDATIDDYYVPTKTGTYEIKYSWNYNGTNRSDSRNIRVLSASESEKERASTRAKTTKQVVSTTANADGLIYEYSGSFSGTNNVKTDTRLLQGDESGNVEPFTLYLEGMIYSDSVVGTYIVDMKDASNSGFDIVYNTVKQNGKDIKAIQVRSWFNGAVFKNANVLNVVPNKPFRLIVYYTPTITTKKSLKVKYIPDITASTTVTGVSIEIPSLQHDEVMYLGGSIKGTKYFKGKINKLAIYNKVDESLIEKSLS